MGKSRSVDDDSWQGAQRKYWEAWIDLARHSPGGADAQIPAGSSEAVRRWWDAVSPAAPSPAREIFARLIDLTQPYVNLAEQIAADATQDTRTAIDAWVESMSPAPAGDDSTETEAPASSAEAFWELPLANWQRAVAALAPIPGIAGHAAKAEDMARVGARLRERADRFLSLPAVGYAREAQEQYQRLVQLYLRYLEALRLYALGFIQLAAPAAQRFHARVEACVPPPHSLRQLYDLWVDACEEVYAEYAVSEEHALRYARLIGALVDVKRQGSVLLDEVLEEMNLPTRREIDSMQRRLHQVSRDHNALRAQVAEIKDRPRRRTRHR